MKKYKLLITSSTIFLFMFLLIGCGNDDSSVDSGVNNDEEVYTLKVATALDTSNLLFYGYPIFKEKVESSGRVKIDYVGGPEAIPAFNQGQAIQNGTIDIAFTAGAYYSELIPEVLVTIFSELTYEEELENGSVEFLDQLHAEKMNAKYLGRIAQGGYTTYTTKKVESIEDFKGLRVRATPAYQPIYEAVGIDVINMEGGEIYNGLDRGLIDGTGWADYSVTDFGVQEVINYQIKPSFYQLDTNVIMNLDKWNELPEDVQEIVSNAAIEAYYEMADAIADEVEEEQKILEEAGVETINLADSEEFIEIAHEAAWEWLEKRVDDIETLKKYFKK